MAVVTLCVHWWMIGEYSVGQCKKCGATKDFAKLRDEEQTRKTFHKGKTKNLASKDLPEFRSDFT